MTLAGLAHFTCRAACLPVYCMELSMQACMVYARLIGPYMLQWPFSLVQAGAFKIYHDLTMVDQARLNAGLRRLMALKAPRAACKEI